MHKQTKSKYPPKWWVNVIKDIEAVVTASKTSFNIPGMVLDYSVDENDVKKGVIIRLPSGEAGYYTSHDPSVLPPVGAIVKSKLPDPDVIVKDPNFETFVFEIIRARIKLVPKIWLRRVIKKMIDNKPITTSEDLKNFSDWVQLSLDLKKDKDLIELLYKATKYEGLKGLERFNDKSPVV